MNVYSFCSSQSMGLLARSRPSPDVLLSTTASKGSSWPWILNAQISPAGGWKAESGDPENGQTEHRASTGPDLQTQNQTISSTQIIVKAEAAFRDSDQHVHVLDGKTEMCPIWCTRQKKWGVWVVIVQGSWLIISVCHFS